MPCLSRTPPLPTGGRPPADHGHVDMGCGVVPRHVLCDGAGSTSMGGKGAALVARTMSVRAHAHFAHTSQAPSDEIVHTWVNDARDSIGDAAMKRSLRPRDFATTMICAITDGAETIVAHIGDGCAVALDAQTQEWIALTWPSHGEYASTTFFVTDDPQPKLAIHRHHRPISALIAFTDGMERLALDFTAHVPHAPFFQGIAAPVLASGAKGRDPALSVQLKRYLDSTAVNARTDDDKTLLVAAHR